MPATLPKRKLPVAVQRRRTFTSVIYTHRSILSARRALYRELDPSCYGWSEAALKSPRWRFIKVIQAGSRRTLPSARSSDSCVKVIAAPLVSSSFTSAIVRFDGGSSEESKLARRFLHSMRPSNGGRSAGSPLFEEFIRKKRFWRQDFFAGGKRESDSFNRFCY